MKNLLILIFCLISFHSLASSTEVDVLYAEFGFPDYNQKNTLCLTIVRIPQTGELLGILEPIEDCFYTRMAKKAPQHKIRLILGRLEKISDPLMREHLQRIDTQLEFYFSDGD